MPSTADGSKGGEVLDGEERRAAGVAMPREHAASGGDAMGLAGRHREPTVPDQATDLGSFESASSNLRQQIVDPIESDGGRVACDSAKRPSRLGEIVRRPRPPVIVRHDGRYGS